VCPALLSCSSLFSVTDVGLVSRGRTSVTLSPYPLPLPSPPHSKLVQKSQMLLFDTSYKADIYQPLTFHNPKPKVPPKVKTAPSFKRPLDVYYQNNQKTSSIERM
jgi:hypothetical protein